MIDLTAFTRVRLHRGRMVHAVAQKRPLRTACGEPLKLEGPTGRPYDHPLPDRQAITCRLCRGRTEA